MVSFTRVVKGNRRRSGEMMFNSAKKYTYFQYVKNMSYPIFIRVSTADMADLGKGNQPGQENGLEEFLQQLQFSKVSEKEFITVRDQNRDCYRILTIKRAGPRVTQYVGPAQRPDYLGEEKIISQGEGYRLYRFRGHGLMVYSFLCHDWELGVHQEFGGPLHETAYRIILGRFLALALAPLGICGFWGVCVDDAMVVMKRSAALGEAVFIDLAKSCLLVPEGVRPLDPGLSFIRLIDNLRGGSHRVMAAEELLSFLSTHCVFFDYNGLSVPIRQIIYNLSLNYRGNIYPKSRFASNIPKHKQMSI